MMCVNSYILPTSLNTILMTSAQIVCFVGSITIFKSHLKLYVGSSTSVHIAIELTGQRLHYFLSDSLNYLLKPDTFHIKNTCK